MISVINTLIDIYRKDIDKVNIILGGDTQAQTEISVNEEVHKLECFILTLELAKIGLINRTSVNNIVNDLGCKLEKHNILLNSDDVVNNKNKTRYINGQINSIKECMNKFKMIIFK